MAAALIVLLLVPLVPSFLRVVSVRGSVTFATKPRLISIVVDSIPVYFYGFLAVGFLAVVLISDVRFSTPKLPLPELWLVLLWAVVPPTILYVISYLTTNSVFVPRYFSDALPGLALLTAWVLTGFEPRPARTILVFTFLAGVFLENSGSIRSRKHFDEDWREAMATVNEVTKRNDTPVLVRSGFIESANPAMFEDPERSQFLLAPLVAYPIGGVTIPLPIHADEYALRRLETIVEQNLLRGDRFIVVSSVVEPRYRAWLKGRLQAASFQDRDLGNFGAVTVHLFERK